MSKLEEYEKLVAVYDAPGSQCRNKDFDVARARIAELEAAYKQDETIIATLRDMEIEASEQLAAATAELAEAKDLLLCAHADAWTNDPNFSLTVDEWKADLANRWPEKEAPR